MSRLTNPQIRCLGSSWHERLRSKRGDPVNANVLEALRAHVRIRRAENVEEDDLLREVEKWWDGQDGARETSLTTHMRRNGLTLGGIP
jgi:hypothetical protein